MPTYFEKFVLSLLYCTFAEMSCFQLTQNKSDRGGARFGKYLC